MIRAGDDHGIQRLRLEMKITTSQMENQIGDAKPRRCRIGRVVKQWTDFAGDVDHDRRAASHAEVRPRGRQAGPDGVDSRGGVGQRRVIGDWGLDLRAAGECQRLARHQDCGAKTPRRPPHWNSWKTCEARSGRFSEADSGPDDFRSDGKEGSPLPSGEGQG